MVQASGCGARCNRNVAALTVVGIHDVVGLKPGHTCDPTAHLSGAPSLTVAMINSSRTLQMGCRPNHPGVLTMGSATEKH